MTDDITSTPAEEDDVAHALAPIDDATQDLATPEELAAFEARFLRLLERRTAIYTMGDSTSVPRHVAADILLSICFVLGIDPERPEVPRGLLSVDLEAEYRRRLGDIERRLTAAEQLWRDVCTTMPLVDNIALRDTLRNLGDFFKWYDYRSMAHEIPCSIDYPLCHPVPESLQGIDYIEEYLRRWMIEAEFLSCFELKAIELVLAASCIDPVEDLINLYEQVATNALGLALLGKDPRGLLIGDQDCAQIERLLEPFGETAQAKVLAEAAASTPIHTGEAADYMGELIRDLLPRIAVGLAHKDVRSVFVG